MNVEAVKLLETKYREKLNGSTPLSIVKKLLNEEHKPNIETLTKSYETLANSFEKKSLKGIDK